MLRARKPTITVSDPVIRFDRLITAPHLGQLEFGRAQQVWQAAAPTFRSNILGAHFEELARDWTLRFAPDELSSPAGFGDVGFATRMSASAPPFRAMVKADAGGSPRLERVLNRALLLLDVLA